MATRQTAKCSKCRHGFSVDQWNIRHTGHDITCDGGQLCICDVNYHSHCCVSCKEETG